MASSPTTQNTGQWPPRRPSKRSKLRNGTFIIPTTGERSRRQFTLRHSREQSDEPEENLLPFFSRQSVSERLSALGHNAKAGSVRLSRWLNSPTGRGILKCTLAYTLASLATFFSPLSNYLGKLDGKHVVATITVYFHPARSAGSMVEAILIALVAVAYALLISISSMATSVLVGSVWNQVLVAHVLILVVFIGGGFGLIGWVKQRMNNPLVNVGSTLASLSIIGVVTKENAVVAHVFSDQKIVQLLKVLLMGVSITSAVNLLVWRVSAVALVRESMPKASSALGEMLCMITRGFLSGSEEEVLSADFTAASAAYSATYPQMLKNLRDAKFERYFVGHEKLYQLDRAVVKSIETLSQSIGGLRSAANTQFALLKETAPGNPPGPFSPGFSPGPFSPRPFSPDSSSPGPSPFASGTSPLSPRLISGGSATLKSGQDRQPVLSAIDEASEDSAGDDAKSPNGKNPVEAPSFRTPSDIFELFIALLGPSMKSLAYTLSEVLREPAFGSAPDYDITINENFRQSLSDALGLLNTARANALQELYTHLELNRARTEQVQADFEEVAAACGHFSFSLQAFGEEMQKYLDVLDDLKYANKYKTRSWRWLMWWKDGAVRRYPWSISTLPYDAEEGESLIKPIKKTALPQGIPDSMVRRRDTYSWQVAATTESSRFVATFSQKLLRLVRKLGRHDFRFGLKVGLGAALFAMFAFIPQTRGTYQHWRGDWGLLSFMIVCSMTVGASNTTGWSRFLGTVAGATASTVNWTLTDGNPIGLIFLGWLVAFGSFWVILARGMAPMGRITLLAYNVSTLYAYSLSQRETEDGDDEGGVDPLILEIVKHRAVSVTVGILWGLIVCRVIWPISARKEFKQGLAVLYLQMGLIWKRGPLAVLLNSGATRSYLKTGEQAALQKYANRLATLRLSANSEFELRGPFPFEATGRLMESTTRILDGFYAMSLVTQRRGELSRGERALLQFTAPERAMLCARICHVFQVLASSMMLEYPLTDAVPTVIGTRDRLLGKIFRFRKEHVPEADQDSGGESSLGALLDPLRVVVEERDYALLYAYALVTGQVADELKVVEKEIEGLFGVLHEEAMLLQ